MHFDVTKLADELFLKESRRILGAVYENPSYQAVEDYTRWLDQNGPLQLLEIAERNSGT